MWSVDLLGSQAFLQHLLARKRAEIRIIDTFHYLLMQ
jgi:hypothetical protein